MEKFFKNFPVTYYTFESDSDPVLITHLLRRFKFKETVKEMVPEYEMYLVSDNETPEMVAYRVYGDSSLHWIILLFNDIVDPFSDWVMNSETLSEYIKEKYGERENSVHHYELNGKTVPYLVDGAISVTNRQFEETVNEYNRKIKIPKILHIGPILEEVKKILKEVK